MKKSEDTLSSTGYHHFDRLGVKTTELQIPSFPDTAPLQSLCRRHSKLSSKPDGSKYVKVDIKWSGLGPPKIQFSPDRSQFFWTVFRDRFQGAGK